MEDKKYSSIIGIYNSEKWKEIEQYSIYYDSMYKYLDRTETKEKIISDLQVLCFGINKILENTIEYLQSKENLNIKEGQKTKIKIYSKDLNIVLDKCIQELKSLNSNISFEYNKTYFNYLELIDIKDSETSNYAYEIANDFKEFIKIEPQETKEPETNNINTYQHQDIFANNGFELFSYILEAYIMPKGKRGRYADISYYYWCMFNNNPKYIHQRPEVFKNWFCENYEDNFNKIKTLIEVEDINRKRNFQTALDWFKLKKCK